MTQPRNIEPGRTLMVTLRTARRVFYFAPSSAVNALIEYVVAFAAKRHNIGITAMVWMSNHAHLVINDHHGCVPDFLQTMNALLARALNKYRGERGGVLARDSVDLKLLDGRDGTLTALAYVGANPVAAACVEHGRDWPGLRTLAKDIGRRERTVTRPAFFFRHRDQGYRGALPETVKLRFELPLAVPEQGRGQFIHDMENAVREAEEKARADVQASGKSFRGAAGCRNVDHRTQADSWEPSGAGTGPSKILTHDEARREAAREELAAFLDAYALAFERWRIGCRDVSFPRGTYRLARTFGAPVAGAPEPGPHVSEPPEPAPSTT